MANDEWGTPQYFFDYLDKIFHFDLDAASTDENAKCAKHYTKEDNALTKDWSQDGDCVWLNPPYSHPLVWVKKAYEESLKGITVVCLVPGDMSTVWFHDWIYGRAEVWIVRGRISFVNSKKGGYKSPQFGNIIAIYGPEAHRGLYVSVTNPRLKGRNWHGKDHPEKC